MQLPYENENYIVVITEGGMGYSVINKTTKVIEAEHSALPRAVIVADEYNDWMLKKHTRSLEAENAGTVISLR